VPDADATRETDTDQGRAILRNLFAAGGETVRMQRPFYDARSRANGFYEHLRAERLCSVGGEFYGGYGWRDLPAVTEERGAAGSDL